MFFEVHSPERSFLPRALECRRRARPHILTSMCVDVRQSEVKEIAVGLDSFRARIDSAMFASNLPLRLSANFTASRVSTERVRKLRFFQWGQYISIDYGRQDVWCFRSRRGGERPAIARIRRLPLSKPRPRARSAARRDQGILAGRCAHRSRPVVALEDGRRALNWPWRF